MCDMTVITFLTRPDSIGLNAAAPMETLGTNDNNGSNVPVPKPRHSLLMRQTKPELMYENSFVQTDNNKPRPICKAPVKTPRKSPPKLHPRSCVSTTSSSQNGAKDIEKDERSLGLLGLNDNERELEFSFLDANSLQIKSNGRLVTLNSKDNSKMHKYNFKSKDFENDIIVVTSTAGIVSSSSSPVKVGKLKSALDTMCTLL